MTRDEAKEKIINDFCKCRVWCELYPDLCQTESCEIWWALKALSDRPQGEWNPYYTKRENNDIFNCKLCGTTFIVMQGKDNMNFCPNCGARMHPGLQGKHFDSIIIDESWKGEGNEND